MKRKRDLPDAVDVESIEQKRCSSEDASASYAQHSTRKGENPVLSIQATMVVAHLEAHAWTVRSFIEL